MARSTGTMKLSSNFEPRLGAPLDGRAIVPTYADLTTADNWPYPYVGMLVAVQATGKVYVLKAVPVTTASNWAEVGKEADLTDYYTKEQVDALIAATYKPSGSVTFANLPTLGADVLGNVYNVTNSFTTDNRFIEGSGKVYPANTNVVVVNTGTTSSPTYMFDALSGLVDLSGYQKTVQYTNMPTATAALATAGTMVQYIGATDSNYTNGYFYKVIEDPNTSGSYIWTHVLTQEEGGSGALESPITVTTPAGGITSGKQYAIGVTYEQLWHDLLDPHLYPTLTAPSGTLTHNNGSLLIKTGATPSVTFTIGLNRGSISPAYGTSGYRSGDKTGCKFDTETSYTTTYTRSVTVTPSASGSRFSKGYKGNVSYAAGERPKDSKGEYYDATALPAGNVDTPTITFEFVSPLWSNDSNINTVAEESLKSASSGSHTFSFPACTAAKPWIFDVPAAWTVTGVSAYNPYTKEWDNVSTEFTITNTTHPDGSTSATAISYKRYTFNKGIDNDARQTKVTWTVS